MLVICGKLLVVFVPLLCLVVEASLPVAVIVFPPDLAAAEADVAEDPVIVVMSEPTLEAEADAEATELVAVAVGLDESTLLVSDLAVEPKMLW